MMPHGRPGRESKTRNQARACARAHAFGVQCHGMDYRLDGRLAHFTYERLLVIGFLIGSSVPGGQEAEMGEQVAFSQRAGV